MFAVVRDDRAPLFRLLAAGVLLFSIALLIASYVAIAIYTGRPWLWSVIVHESGDRTLQQTIFYYEHTARELPLDLLLGMAVAAGALFAFPASPVSRSRGRQTFFAVGTALSVVVIVAGTLWTGGPGMLYENLLQYPTRPGEPLVWGGHWRYHLLSHVTLMLSSFGLAAPVLVLAGRSGGYRTGLNVFAAAFGIFLALAVVFVPGPSSFRDPVYLGHQVREVLTHALVTVPMAWGVCLLLARDVWNDRTPATAPMSAAVAAAVLGAVVGLALLAAGLATSATSHGQSESVAVLIFPHFFEHTFSYAVTTLTAGLVFEWGMRSRAADR